MLTFVACNGVRAGIDLNIGTGVGAGIGANIGRTNDGKNICSTIVTITIITY